MTVLPLVAELLAGLPYLVPALALLATLALGRYPGARRLARSARIRPARAAAPPAAAPLRPLARVARGGRLMARGLAVRPPPPAARLRA